MEKIIGLAIQARKQEKSKQEKKSVVKTGEELEITCLCMVETQHMNKRTVFN